MGNPRNPVPASAAWLGGLGFLPFLGLASALPFLDGDLRTRAGLALAGYGAVILSFLGGIHWGLAIAADAPGGDRLAVRLGLSVLPSLVAWAALALPTQTGLLLLALAMAAMLAVDLRASRIGQAPAWYPRLRWPLACAVIAALVAGGLA